MARPPRVRNAVAKLLSESERHDWTLEEVAGELAAAGTSADFSSVYRSIEALLAAGIVRRVELGTPDSRFESAGAHHEHVRCESCGRVAGVPGCMVRRPADVEKLTGFVVSGHELLFNGLCPACAKAGPRVADSRSERTRRS